MCTVHRWSTRHDATFVIGSPVHNMTAPAIIPHIRTFKNKNNVQCPVELGLPANRENTRCSRALTGNGKHGCRSSLPAITGNLHTSDELSRPTSLKRSIF